jgi:hypothetical protein
VLFEQMAKAQDGALVGQRSLRPPSPTKSRSSDVLN